MSQVSTFNMVQQERYEGVMAALCTTVILLAAGVVSIAAGVLSLAP